MSYSALFTSGLALAPYPLDSPVRTTARPSLQINIHPSTPAHPRLRKRRSSLTIATSPISAIKSPTRSVNDSLRMALRSPKDANFMETLQNIARPKPVRRKTVSSVPIAQPAPTSPLPTPPPSAFTFYPPSTPMTPTEDACPSSPITSESPFPRTPFENTYLRPANPSRKSSTLLPPSIRSSGGGRGPLAPSAYAGNASPGPYTDERHDPELEWDMRMLTAEKGATVPATAWFDDDEDMKENDEA